MFQDMITSFTQNGVLLNTFKILFYTAPIWLPVLLGAMFVQIWMRYIRTLFISKQGSVLLEIRLPKEMLKSPLAVEIFLTSLFQTANSTYIEAYWAGKVRPWFSLELVSIEGKAKFYIWAHKKFKGLIETQLYAQFPNIEVFESPDYTTWAYHDPVNLPMWGAQFVLTGPDALPIKTYVDY